MQVRYKCIIKKLDENSLMDFVLSYYEYFWRNSQVEKGTGLQTL